MGITLNKVFIEKLRAFEMTALEYIRAKETDKTCNDAQKNKCAAEFGEFLQWACKKCEQRAMTSDDADK